MAGNPYTGTYAPSKTSFSRNEIIAGLKGIKVKAPNRKRSGTAYKSALPKEHGEQK